MIASLGALVAVLSFQLAVPDLAFAHAELTIPQPRSPGGKLPVRVAQIHNLESPPMVAERHGPLSRRW